MRNLVNNMIKAILIHLMDLYNSHISANTGTIYIMHSMYGLLQPL